MAREIEFGTNVKGVKKDINYLGRDFANIRSNLIEFAKQYFQMHTMILMKHHQV